MKTPILNTPARGVRDVDNELLKKMMTKQIVSMTMRGEDIARKYKNTLSLLDIKNPMTTYLQDVDSFDLSSLGVTHTKRTSGSMNTNQYAQQSYAAKFEKIPDHYVKYINTEFNRIEGIQARIDITTYKNEANQNSHNITASDVVTIKKSIIPLMTEYIKTTMVKIATCYTSFINGVAVLGLPSLTAAYKTTELNTLGGIGKCSVSMTLDGITINAICLITEMTRTTYVSLMCQITPTALLATVALIRMQQYDATSNLASVLQMEAEDQAIMVACMYQTDIAMTIAMYSAYSIALRIAGFEPYSTINAWMIKDTEETFMSIQDKPNVFDIEHAGEHAVSMTVFCSDILQ